MVEPGEVAFCLRLQLGGRRPHAATTTTTEAIDRAPAPGCQLLPQPRSASPGLHRIPPPPLHAPHAPRTAPLGSEPARAPAPPGTRPPARSVPVWQHVCGRAGTVRPRPPSPAARPPARSLLQLPPHRRARLHRLALRRPRSAGGRGPGTPLRSQCGDGPPARPPETLHWSFSPAPRPRLPRPSAPPSRNPSTAPHPKPRLLRSRPPESPSPGPAPPEAPPSRGPEVCSPSWQLVWRALEVGGCFLEYSPWGLLEAVALTGIEKY